MAGFEGFVLAGGSSRRMGQDKAFVEVGGRPLVLRALDALAESTRVTIVGGNRDRFEQLGLPWISDREPGAGPMNGILTALSASRQPVAVVLGCDLTGISTTGVDHLVGAIGDADVCVPIVGDRAQWMAAAWRTRTLPDLSRAFDLGERSVYGCVRGLRVSHLLDTDDAWYRDADEPSDIDGLE